MNNFSTMTIAQPETLPSMPDNLHGSTIAHPPVGLFALAVIAGAVLVVALSVVSLDTAALGFPALVAGLAFYALAAFAAGYGFARAYPHRALGWCTLVTLGRLAIVAALASALLAAVTPSWTILWLAVLALALDGVDGWLARRQGVSSSFGAQFDMEVDAAFALVLALLATLHGTAPVAVIVLAMPHYLFRLARHFLPWLGAALPERFSRKVVCVAQIGALVALQIPLLSPGSLDPLLLLVAAALAWSFGRDILWLWRARP
jgi:phosphatidylglycerophosphate synthase